MSRIATDWAWGLNLTPPQKLLMLSLADRADEYHCCYPSIQRLVNDTGLDRKTIGKWINRMIESGMIHDTGERKGPTKRVRVLQLNVGFECTQKRDDSKTGNDPKIGILNDPKIGILNDPKIGTQNQSLEPNIESNIKPSTSENSNESSDGCLNVIQITRPDAAIQRGTKWGTSEDLRCAEWLFSVVQSISSTAKRPNYASWANDIRLMREGDGRTHKEIATLFKWACDDDFWKGNVLCPATLRKKWTQLDIKRQKLASGKPAERPKVDLTNTDWIYGVQL
ncbi:primosomal protein I [Edwardsiella phage Edno5]|uniref:Primosomal protein I n=1 Tax=Edwardsiella phage Edno5 TaxID=2419942 RepID=A0A3G3BY72_9CAUD|nr:helix-turn-helix domain-containing protein [Edwardsiella anguillarum]YP_010052866.1 replication initiation O-like [Edwardsiella phage Edno5]AKM48217.1 hypothetical protein QY76_13620 [Edwardsiella sp. EA181011]AYP69188.1 primosomal protein I [Edwardsiella phage Edno5]RFT04053.1 helix-turn-helix domain-containing protein [Edwardsiella anguillarum]